MRTCVNKEIRKTEQRVLARRITAVIHGLISVFFVGMSVWSRRLLFNHLASGSVPLHSISGNCFCYNTGSANALKACHVNMHLWVCLCVSVLPPPTA